MTMATSLPAPARHLAWHKAMALLLCLQLLWPATVVAEPARLRIAQTEGMGYPLLTLNGPSEVSGGFLKELGDRVAELLGTQAEHIVYSRRRVEQAVLGGSADMLCYSSPLWVKNVDEHWTIALLPQIERVVVPAASSLVYGGPEDLAGMRIAVMLGYNFPALQPLFDSGRATRVNETRVDLLFRQLELGIADAMIVSEAEIEGYFKTRPAERERYKVSSKAYSSVDTRCLVSPQSNWALTAIDRALLTMLKSGEIARMAQRYGMSMR
ncbi:substrate-binding periplasmic protein [Roseateles toxinivorans]|uniref:Amino acid ABC transporter substrate-binding protein (PAAT family) n=1 Tax=Roseateles toxinivorans TaxID=270368 RepID=A0A4V3CTT3_9BURK|nr:transporter substrate-binding domain-containing protein [Roseateles toxinivorans]TDP74038.1 amino acid ABC transporter substrate-binding protein (PAAT family) [Roseateles toxinivorans]